MGGLVAALLSLGVGDARLFQFHVDRVIAVDETLRSELLQMVQAEQDLHTELSDSGEIYGGYHPRLAELNARQANRLAEIIDEQGWPGRSVVDADGAHAAWFTAIHAIGLPDFQRRALPLLQDAVSRGDADPAMAAMLEDKIAFMERRPQRYGSQFDWGDDGELEPWTLEDPEHVDEWRAEVGLGPLAQKVAQFKGSPGAPEDLKAYRRQFEDWRRSVGWP